MHISYVYIILLERPPRIEHSSPSSPSSRNREKVWPQPPRSQFFYFHSFSFFSHWKLNTRNFFPWRKINICVNSPAFIYNYFSLLFFFGFFFSDGEKLGNAELMIFWGKGPVNIYIYIYIINFLYTAFIEESTKMCADHEAFICVN